MMRFLGSIFGGSAEEKNERAVGEIDPSKTRDDTSGVLAVTGDLPQDKNPLATFYNYLEAKKDEFNAGMETWEKHYKAIAALADTKSCSAEHEQCVLETGAQAQSTFMLIKEKLKQAFESEDAYFKAKLAEAESNVATMGEHIQSLSKKFNECEDEQERREAAIHLSRAQIYLLRELVDFMQCITQSLQGAVNAEKKVEALVGFLLNMFEVMVLKIPGKDYTPDLSESYQNFLDRKSEFEQLGTRVMLDNVLALSAQTEQVALDAENLTDKPASKSASPLLKRTNSKSHLFQPVVGSLAAAAVAEAMNNNNVTSLRRSK